MTVLKAVKLLNDSGYQDKLVLDIIGVGEQYDKLNNYALKHELLNINFRGMKKNNEIPSILVNQDVLILPSIHDGWGAVVNESLLAGLYTICSDRCGSKDLLDDERRGQVFKMRDYKQLANILKYCCDNLNSIRADINYRRDWAQKSISGQVIAQYIIDCLTQETKPGLPWK
jgi:glycosyltransferase involved in cell wall biosynthesis